MPQPDAQPLAQRCGIDVEPGIASKLCARGGGRCFADTRTFGIPYDRGARWIHMPDTNPVAKLGLKPGLDIYAAPLSQRLRIGLRHAREGEMEDFVANLWRCNRASYKASRGRTEVSCAHAPPAS